MSEIPDFLCYGSRATNAHFASSIPYGASTIQAGSATTSSYFILDESGSIRMNRGISDTSVHPEHPRMTTNAPKVPVRSYTGMDHIYRNGLLEWTLRCPPGYFLCTLLG